MTKQEFCDWAKGRGWTQDRFGHLHSKTGDYRFKVQAHSVRLEKKCYHGLNEYTGRSETSWVRIKSGYFKKLSLSAEGKLVGMMSGSIGIEAK